jgi:hypothetical protein
MNNPSAINLNAVRLCFQVILKTKKDNRNVSVSLKPIVTNIIFDIKANAFLKIHKISHFSSPVDGGGIKMILLCDKVTLKIYSNK